MRPYVIRAGDYLLQLADRFGFDPETVWQHGDNADLRAARTDPQQLAPGDVLQIPDTAPEPLQLQNGSSNKFKGHVRKVEVHFTLRAGNELLANEPYQVEGIPGPPIRGNSDGDGKISFHVPTAVRSVSVYLPHMARRMPIVVGGIDPIDTPMGARQRLANLGCYGTGHEAEEGAAVADDARARTATLVFQRRHGLAATGEIDAATRTALADAHDAAAPPPEEQGGS